jgi:NAD(P)-dependent dehydrogenase (short-subunit alcohol dehydrogenase family)
MTRDAAPQDQAARNPLARDPLARDPLARDPLARDPLALFRLAGRSIVITGASGALGGVVAEALGALGARLTLASGSAEALAAVAGRTREAGRAAGGEVVTVAARPDSEADAGGILDAAIAAFGAVDSIFVASGLNKPSIIEEQSYADWQQVMDANVRGPWLLARALGRHVTDRGGRGKLLLVSSVRGRHGHPAGYSAYCTAKGAVDALTRTLATEWGPRGINVNAIAPAVFPSALTGWIFADTEAGRAARERNMSRIPVKRLVTPEDVVGAAIYLLSAASDWVTGQILYVDGGYTAA